MGGNDPGSADIRVVKKWAAGRKNNNFFCSFESPISLSNCQILSNGVNCCQFQANTVNRSRARKHYVTICRNTKFLLTRTIFQSTIRHNFEKCFSSFGIVCTTRRDRTVAEKQDGGAFASRLNRYPAGSRSCRARPAPRHESPPASASKANPASPELRPRRLRVYTGSCCLHVSYP
jgi:hypothetical protein